MSPHSATQNPMTAITTPSVKFMMKLMNTRSRYEEIFSFFCSAEMPMKNASHLDLSGNSNKYVIV